MTKKVDRYERWAITGNCGLYVDQSLYRRDAVAKHVECLYGEPSQYAGGPEAAALRKQQWAKCTKKGDRVVKVTILAPSP